MRNGVWRLFLLFVCAGGLPAWAAQVWVDAHWVDAANCGGHVWQTDAFSSIQAALDAAAEGGTVRVAPGRYAEQLIIAKSVHLQGPGEGVNPNAPTTDDPFSANPARGNAADEALVISPPNSIGPQVTIQADRVSIAGFTFDSNMTAAATTSRPGIINEGRRQEIVITYNILRNFIGGAISLVNGNPNIPLIDQHVIAYNRIENPPFDERLNDRTECRGITLNCDMADIIGNTIINADTGIQLRWIAHGNPPMIAPTISGNSLQCSGSGILFCLINDAKLNGQFSQTAPRVMVSYNRIRMLQEGPPLFARAGVTILSADHNSKVLLFDNDLAGGDAGVFVWNSNSMNAGNTVICDGIIHDTKYGVWITNYYATEPVPAQPTKVLLNGVNILNPTVAGLFLSDETKGTGEVSAVFMNGTTISGGPIGILLRGEHSLLTLLPGARPPVDMSGQTDHFIVLQDNGVTYPPAIDISSAAFNGKTRGDMTPEERTALEIRLIDQQDDPKLGRLY